SGGHYTTTLWDLRSGAAYEQADHIDLAIDVDGGWVALHSLQTFEIVLWHGPSDTMVTGPRALYDTSNAPNLRFIAPDQLEFVSAGGAWTRWHLPVPRGTEPLKAWLEQATNMPAPPLE
ncbi:MAG: hypothetical protein KC457_20275, partial [Myxococcales bacterium]|nr:hypothetical protein [Myxococcales bacterium]